MTFGFVISQMKTLVSTAVKRVDQTANVSSMATLSGKQNDIILF